MYIFGLIFFGLIAGFWLTYGLSVMSAGFRLPRLKNFAPAKDEDCPTISVLFAARDEEKTMPAALATVVASDYPNLEIVAVDDRSTDATGQIMEELASQHRRLRVVRVRELPAGWLGKPHGLQKGYEASTGEWLVFTDADVHFAPDLLRRAIALAAARNLDHLTLLGDVEMNGFWDRSLLTFFALGFSIASNASAVSNSKSKAYVGVGAFQLVRRSAYEGSGTHVRLAMEVVDDMKLGKIVKEAGFRSGAALAQTFVSVQWHSGLGNIIRGVTKNFFATAQYNVAVVAIVVAGLFCTDVVSWILAPFLRGWMLLFALIAIAMPLIYHASIALVMGVSPLYALTHPIDAVLWCYMLVRSTAITLRQDGVRWRDTFYNLKDLRKGSV